MKKIVSLLMAAVLTLTFSACSGGIQEDEAKAHIHAFFSAVEAEDYELAATFLHPERPADLKAFFEGLESEKDLDFSNIEIVNYTGFSSTNYDSVLDGSAYSLKMDTSVSGEAVKIEIEIVKNGNGYGIYNLDVDL